MGNADGEMESLYDPAYVSSLPRFVLGCGSWPTAICKRDTPEMKTLRRQLEAWYAALPVEVRPRFYARLRSKNNNTDFAGAFAELATRHWLLGNLPIEDLEYELPVGKGNPDFSVSLPRGEAFIAEVYAPHGIGGGEGRDAVADEFYRQCDRWLPNGYHLDMSPHCRPRTQEEVSSLVRALREELERQSPAEGHEIAVPFRNGECKFVVLKRGRAGSTRVEDGTTVAPIAPTHQHIRRHIQEKAADFREGLDKPLVFFVVDETGWALGEDDWLQVCYGVESGQRTVAPDGSGAPALTPQPGQGGLFTRHERGQPRSTYISAVMAGRWHCDSTGVSTEFTGFANPFGVRQVPRTLDQVVPFWVPSGKADGRLVRTPGPS